MSYPKVTTTDRAIPDQNRSHNSVQVSHIWAGVQVLGHLILPSQIHVPEGNRIGSKVTGTGNYAPKWNNASKAVAQPTVPQFQTSPKLVMSV